MRSRTGMRSLRWRESGFINSNQRRSKMHGGGYERLKGRGGGDALGSARSGNRNKRRGAADARRDGGLEGGCLGRSGDQSARRTELRVLPRPASAGAVCEHSLQALPDRALRAEVAGKGALD